MLVAEYPELAAVTPDYRDFGENVELAAPAAQGPAQGCRTATGTHHAKTVLGFTYFDMTTSVNYCWNARKVTSVSGLKTTFANVASTAEIGGEIEATTETGAQGYAKHVYMVKNVVPVWGQIGVVYPHNTFNLYKRASYSHTHGE